MSNIIFYKVPVFNSNGEFVKIREMYNFVTGKKVRAGDALIDEVLEGMVDEDIKINNKKEYAKFLEAEKAKLLEAVEAKLGGSFSEPKEPTEDESDLTSNTKLLEAVEAKLGEDSI